MGSIDLCGTFFQVERWDNPRVTVTVTSTGVTLETAKGKETIPSSALVGSLLNLNEFTIVAMVERNGQTQIAKRRIRCANLKTAADWTTAIRLVARGVNETLPKRSILVLLNPLSGRKKARVIWAHAKEILDAAGIDVVVQETAYAGHAAVLGATLSLEGIHGVVTCSGDGLLWEVLQGVLVRPDWERIVQRVTFGIIPAGSGNGMAASLGLLDPLVAAAVVAKDCMRPLDVAAVRQQDESGVMRTWWNFLMLTWGMLADCDIGSEYLRWMGGQRFVVEGVKRLVKMQRYQGRVGYLPANDPEDALPQPCTGTLEDCPECDVLKPPSTDDAPPEPCETYNVADLKKGSVSGAAAMLPSRVPADMNLDEPPEGWAVMDDRAFVVVLAVNQSHLSYDTCATVAAHASDGKLDLLVVPSMKRAAGTKVLLEMESGRAFLDAPGSFVRKVFALAIEPTDPAAMGIMDADGEELASRMTTMEVYRSLIRVYAKSTGVN